MLPLITTYLKELFETKIGTATTGSSLAGIVRVFDGDPLTYDQRDMPAIIVEAIDTSMQKMNNYYQATRRIKISVVIATKQFYMSGDPGIISVKKYVQELMEGKSESSCGFSADSISGILKAIQCIIVDNCTIANDFYIESVQYSNLSGEGFVGYRGDMTTRTFNMQIPKF